MLKKIMSFAAMVIGLAIIIIGVNTYYCASSGYNYAYSAEHVEAKELHKTYYDVKGASFGADFYSYIYDASDEIVSELNDSLNAYDEINKSIVRFTNKVNDGNRNISMEINNLGYHLEKVFGLIIIAIGLATFAYSLFNIAVAFESCPNTPEKKDGILKGSISGDENTTCDNFENKSLEKETEQQSVAE